jgi:hypothetical protein
MASSRLRVFVASVLFATFVAAPTFADEGMWTFDNFPADTLKSTYGVTVTQPWLDRLRLSIVRLSGCTGSFVSADGLILTNHHCVAGCLNDLSTPQQNLRSQGFLARQRPEERRCPTQIADVLVAMDDVTSQVAAATRGLSDQAANDARKKTLTALEQSCEEASRKEMGTLPISPSSRTDSASRETGSVPNSLPLKCEAVTLYEGGQYFIYKYRRYTDVRVVFAPEADIAAFGGDPDNFQFPRWCLDMAMLRAYENGRPVATKTFLRVNFNGPAKDDPVFVAGHPGSTDRLLTVGQLLDRRANAPESLLRLSELRGRYIQFAKTGSEPARIVHDPLQSIENSIKVSRKQLDALLDERLMQSKSKQEAELRAAAVTDKKLSADTARAWDDLDRALKVGRGLRLPYSQLEGGAAFSSQLFRYARLLLRGTVEREKPNTERLREFADARLPRIRQQLQAATPVYPALEKLTLSFSLERMREHLGPDHALVRSLLREDSPDSLAEKLISASKLGDATVRTKLWEGGADAVAASDDPMLELARRVDSDARQIRKRFEDEVEAPVRVASERIAAARFATSGTRVYPDATFTLRLNYGAVRGWQDERGEIAPFTQLGRLFERATGTAPFRIPDSWQAVRTQLDMTTRFNLATTNDIIGGNSGSPLVDARGELVGLIFDGNIHSISGAFWFDAEKNRAVAVHPAIMKVALEKVYRADALMKELTIAN